MNWSLIAALFSLFGVIATIVGVAYTSGQFSQRVHASEEQNKLHAIRLDEHAKQLSSHDVKLGRIEEWKSGLSTGARLSKEAQ
jgi:hypothetical protein